MITGQKVAVRTGAQQALRGLQNGTGEAGMVLSGHLCIPSGGDVLVVLLTSTLHRPKPWDVTFITLHTRLSYAQSGSENGQNCPVLGKCDGNVFVTWRNVLTQSCS